MNDDEQSDVNDDGEVATADDGGDIGAGEDPVGDSESTASEAADDQLAADESETTAGDGAKKTSVDDGNEQTEVKDGDAETDEGNQAETQRQTEEYEFGALGRSTLPTAIQYTPEFDDEWIYPTGEKDGGSRDDVPVQGLELGVLATEADLRETVVAVLNGLASYHDASGEYPRHRFVADAESFEITDGVGLAAIIQPRPDQYDGLIDHMQAMGSEPEALTPNRDRAWQVAAHLHSALAAADEVDETASEVAANAVWPTGKRLGESRLLERYSALAAGGLYDPTVGEVDLDGPGLDSVRDVTFTPEYLAVDDIDELRLDHSFDDVDGTSDSEKGGSDEQRVDDESVATASEKRDVNMEATTSDEEATASDEEATASDEEATDSDG